MPFDKDGTPTPETLARVEHYFDDKPFNDKTVGEFVKYVYDLWRSNLINLKGDLLFISTGGWHANEALIMAMQKTSFWYLCWRMSRFGGHYQFDLSKVPKAGESDE